MKMGFLMHTRHVAPFVLLTAAILLTAASVSTASVAEGSLRSAVVTASYLPVRSSPTMVTATIAQLFQRDTVSLTGVRSTDGRWVQVKMAGVEAGWVPTDAIRLRFPVIDLAMTDDPALALGQERGGVAVVNTPLSSAMNTVEPSGAVVAQLTRGDQVELAGFRTADSKWVEIVLPDGRAAWVDASSISSDFPLSALSKIDAAIRD